MLGQKKILVSFTATLPNPQARQSEGSTRRAATGGIINRKLATIAVSAAAAVSLGLGLGACGSSSSSDAAAQVCQQQIGQTYQRWSSSEDH